MYMTVAKKDPWKFPLARSTAKGIHEFVIANSVLSLSMPTTLHKHHFRFD